MNLVSMSGGASSSGMFMKLFEAVEKSLRRLSLAFVEIPCSSAQVMAP